MSIAFEFPSVLFSANAPLSTQKHDPTFPLPGEVGQPSNVFDPTMSKSAVIVGETSHACA
jgi:hypothetical protein